MAKLNNLAFLIVCIFALVGAANAFADDIQFEIPDLVVQYPYSTRSVTLEAFKVRNRTANEHPQWVSVGYPTIVNDSDGQHFHFTSEYVSVYLRTLDSGQKEALVRKAKAKYPNAVITPDSIIPLPLAKFFCIMSFFVNGNSFEISATANDLLTNPLMLRFPCDEWSKPRIFLKKRLLFSDPLFLECDAAATGKLERVNTLKITMEEMRQLGLADKLLGPADEKYVARQQLTQLSQEIVANLRIEENYEVEGETFGEEFIHKLLDSTMSQFQLVPIDEALSQMSKYGVPMNQRDLAPSEIKREMSKVLQVKEVGDRKRVISVGTASDRNVSSTGDNFGGRAGIKIGIWPFDADLKADIAYVQQQSNEWAKNTTMLEDQLTDLNQHSASDITWEQEGTRIVPKHLNVAKVSRMNLNRQLSFHRIRRKITNARYSQRFDISTNAKDLGAGEQSLQTTNARMEEALRVLNESFAREIQSLKRIDAELRSENSNLRAKIADATTTTCVNKTTSGSMSDRLGVGSKIYTALKNIKCGTDGDWHLQGITWDHWKKDGNDWRLSATYYCCNKNGNCVRKTNENEGGWGASYGGGFFRFALKNFDCGGSEWYLNDIFWRHWESRMIDGEENMILNANYRCCKRGK